MQGKKKEKWKVIVGIISIIFILFLWVRKDITTIYSTMPKEQLLPVIITSIVVTLVKIIGITTVILLAKWIFGKDKNRKN